MISPEENCDDGSNDGNGCKVGCTTGQDPDWYCFGGSPTAATEC